MKFIGLYFLLFLILLFSCTIPPDNFIIDNARAEVCILYYDSNFKKALLTRLGDDLNNQRISTYVDTFDKMNDYDPGDFDAVILLSGVTGGNPLPLTVEYIKKHNYKDNIIYFCAYMISQDAVYGSTIDQSKIDAITSASSKNGVESVSEDIVEKVLRIIK